MYETPSCQIEQALTRCREMITVGSKSFSLAARLFGANSRAAAFFLYGWCRYCDDQIDDAKTHREAVSQLQELKFQTQSCFDGDKQEHPVFIAFQHVTKKYGIPQHYPLELLEGMAMDVDGFKYETLQELKLYCYRVAGTVGLMMVHIMGISDEKALKNAADLGSAMQMTNIARDILTDFGMGRVYLPREWLQEIGLSEGDVGKPENRQKVALLVHRLLMEARTYYLSGKEGLSYLPLRAAFAVSAACSVYSQIGEAVLARGPKAWDSRTIVPQWKKMLALAQGVFLVLLTIPKRITRPWNSVPITIVWRHS
jgi:phytoene synthase